MFLCVHVRVWVWLSMSDCRMKECRNMYLYTHAHQVARICYRMHKFAHTLIYSLACTRTYNSHLNGKKLISQNLTILLLPKANNSYVSVPPPASPSVSRSCSHSLLFSPISFSPSCYIAIVQTVFVRGCVYLCVFFCVGLPTVQTNNKQLIRENANHQPIASYWHKRKALGSVVNSYGVNRNNGAS